MLADAAVSPSIPAKDLQRATTFYREVLGLTVTDEMEGAAVIFAGGKGTKVFVYASEHAGTNKATAAGWEVDDLDAVMAELRGRGVTFEEYDMPGLKTVDGVAAGEEGKVAWFKDTEGNILSLGQLA